MMEVPQIEKVEICIKSSDDKNFNQSVYIPRSEFESYILPSDSIDSLYDENANIEIISPVLRRQGGYSWKGIYEKSKQVIDFSMGDKSFKQEIEDDGISFQHGTFLSCKLEIKRKLNEDGDIVNNGYKVEAVYEHHIGDSIIITQSGKQRRQQKEIEASQSLLPFDELKNNEDKD